MDREVATWLQNRGFALMKIDIFPHEESGIGVWTEILLWLMVGSVEGKLHDY
jgi:hypothetical protein